MHSCNKVEQSKQSGEEVGEVAKDQKKLPWHRPLSTIDLLPSPSPATDYISQDPVQHLGGACDCTGAKEM